MKILVSCEESQAVTKELRKLGIKNKLVLDAGCGTGFFSNILNNMNAKVVGLDIITKNAISAKQNIPRILSVGGDISVLPFKDDIFDLILCTEVLEHASDDVRALNEFFRTLKKKGTLILTVPNNDYKKSSLESFLFSVFYELTNLIYINKEHEELHRNFYSVHELTGKIKKSGFKIISYFTIGKFFGVSINTIVMIFERIDRILRFKENLEMHLAESIKLEV